MKVLRLFLLSVICLSASLALAADMKEKVTFAADYVGLHPGVDPGMYVCGGGHFHVRGKVQNQSETPLYRVKVEAKAFDAAGNLLGTAADATKQDFILPNEKVDIDLEFRSIPGNNIKDVKKYVVVVVKADSRN